MSLDTRTELWNYDAEAALIGAVLTNPERYHDAAGRVDAEDFATESHRIVWRAIAELDRPDLLSVADRTRADEHITGGMAYLAGLCRDAPTQTAESVVRCAGIVRDYARRRTLLTFASDTHAAAYRMTAPEALADTHQRLQAMDSDEDREPRPVADLLPAWVDDLQTRFESGSELLGLSTGLHDLDHLTGGLAAGRLYTIAARPAMGKSILGLQLAMTAAEHGNPALFVSLEMPETELLYRAQSALTGIDLGRLQRAHDLGSEDFAAVTSAASRLHGWPLRILDTGRLSIGDLTALVQRQHRKHGIRLLVVDYLQLMDGIGDNRTQQIGSISRGLKRIAKELSIPVVVLSQLNRSLEQRGDKRPILADLRESGEIEQDSDVVLMLYRDEIYNPESKWAGIVELIARKQRNGRIGTVRAAFRGDVARIDGLAHGWTPPADDIPQSVKGREYFV